MYMANQNYFFLAFPEFDDKDNEMTTNEWVNSDIPSAKEYDEWAKRIKTFREFYKDEECELVYDSQNVKACLYFVEQLPDCYPNRKREFYTILHGLEDWRRNRITNQDDSCIVHYKTITDEIRTEVAARMLAQTGSSFLIVVHLDGYGSKRWKATIYDKPIEIESLPLNVLAVFNWLSLHHKPLREYRWNEKHGEFGKNAKNNKGEEVSLLLSSKEHASDLLPHAVGENGFDELHVYDDDFKSFMEFKAEAKKQNLQEDTRTRYYHSYHLSEDKEKDIPPRVRWKIDMLKK